jgi:hypothetical protein
MANKTWDYVVSYQDPKDVKTKTPAKRGELDFECKATTAARALSIAKRELSSQHKVPARDLIILDVVRWDTPLVDEWAEAEG